MKKNIFTPEERSSMMASLSCYYDRLHELQSTTKDSERCKKLEKEKDMVLRIAKKVFDLK